MSLDCRFEESDPVDSVVERALHVVTSILGDPDKMNFIRDLYTLASMPQLDGIKSAFNPERNLADVKLAIYPGLLPEDFQAVLDALSFRDPDLRKLINSARN